MKSIANTSFCSHYLRVPKNKQKTPTRLAKIGIGMLNILLLFTTSNARSSITFHSIRISNTPRSLLSTHSNTYCQNTRCMTDRQAFSQAGFKKQILIIYIYIYIYLNIFFSGRARVSNSSFMPALPQRHASIMLCHFPPNPGYFFLFFLLHSRSQQLLHQTPNEDQQCNQSPINNRNKSIKDIDNICIYTQKES